VAAWRLCSSLVVGHYHGQLGTSRRLQDARLLHRPASSFSHAKALLGASGQRLEGATDARGASCVTGSWAARRHQHGGVSPFNAAAVKPEAAGNPGTSGTEGESSPVKVGDILQLTCESLAVGGEGVCRLACGMVCFVHRGWPGEVLWARVTKVSKRFVNATKTETVRGHHSPCRAPCQHFGPCGGCALQTIEYDAQLPWKRRHVVDSLRKIAGLEDAEALVKPIVGSQQEYGYRNKVSFSFSTVRWDPAKGCFDDPNVLGGSWVLGFHRQGRHDQVLHISECKLQGDSANRALQIVRREAQVLGLQPWEPATRTGLLCDLVIRSGTCPDTGNTTLLVQLITGREAEDAELQPLVEALVQEVPDVRGVVASAPVPHKPARGRGKGKPHRKGQQQPPARAGTGGTRVMGKPALLHGDPVIMENLLGLWFEVSASSFFQTNPRQTEVLYSLAGEAAGLSEDGSDVLLDLYCGTGTIGLSLARRCQAVYGFEVVGSAVVDARTNAARNGITNAQFFEGDLEEVSSTIEKTIQRRPDVVITDPARAGMSPSVISFLRRCGARRVVYVSCNVTTQMRDLRDLALPAKLPGEQAYCLTTVTPVDMFPQTAHVETVAVLEPC